MRILAMNLKTNDMKTYTKTELKKKRGFELAEILFQLTGNRHSYRNKEMIEKILELQLKR